MNIMHYDNILEQIKKKNRITRGILLVIGCFIVAIIYNSFIVPNNIVYGGVGGLAIIVNKITGIDITLFINIATLALAFLSLILLGLKKTSYTIVGFLIYTIMINITSPFASIFTFHFPSYLFSIIVYAFVDGIGFGLIYKSGFNTGGMDSIIAIAQKYFSFPTSKLSNITNGMIVVCGAIIFGITNSIYAIIYLKTMNFFSDRTILGVSTKKICFIKTKKEHEVEQLLKKDLEIGYTLIESTNGIGFFKKNIIMTVIPTDRYYDLRSEIQSLDNTAVVITNDCYTVIGGKINNLINV